MTEAVPILLASIAGYLLGSIPFGLLLTRAAGLGDIRKVGSGNIGATNVLRTGRKDLAIATLLLDGGKGAAALLLGRLLGGDTVGLVAGFSAFLGHCYPVWLGGKGGKGVATGAGALAAADPLVGVASLAAWLAGLGLTRTSSVGALAAMAVAPVAAFLLSGPAVGIFALALVVLGVWKHRPNIQRLLAGTEPKVGGAKPAPPSPPPGP